MYAQAVKRGCGTRQKGGIYGELGLSEDGVPLEAYIVDPPIPISMEALGMTPIAVKLVEKNGIFHLFDYCGETYYPNVADFLEEVRRFGMSRRLQKGLDFSKLTSESRIVMIHRKAWIEKTAAYFQDWRTIPGLLWERCPKEGVGSKHPETYETCAGLWWQDIDKDGGEIVFDENVNPRDINRKMPSFQYYAALTPDGHVPEYAPAIFASFPIGRLAVVRDPEGGAHEEAAEAASKSALPVDITED